jgi:hypothetical protein
LLGGKVEINAIENGPGGSGGMITNGLQTEHGGGKTGAGFILSTAFSDRAAIAIGHSTHQILVAIFEVGANYLSQTIYQGLRSCLG